MRDGEEAGRRSIRDFPATAIKTKPVFLPVLAKQLTPLPLWGVVAQSSDQKNPTPSTWNTRVPVDATNTATPGLVSTNSRTSTAIQKAAIMAAAKISRYNCTATLSVCPKSYCII